MSIQCAICYLNLTKMFHFSINYNEGRKIGTLQQRGKLEIVVQIKLMPTNCAKSYPSSKQGDAVLSFTQSLCHG